MKKDPNAWTADVELQQVRDRIIFYLLDLKDFGYQKREWLKKKGFDTEFDYQIYYAVEFILEDLVLERDIVSETIPIRLIGSSLKSEREAAALYKVAVELNNLVRDAYLKTNPGENAKNEVYLSSPYLPKLHQASRQAFDIFMENEKDNKEFCSFIEDLKRKEGRT